VIGRAARRREARLRREAAAWFAKLRGPDALRHQVAFEAWRNADPAHAATYDRLLQHWDRAAVLATPEALQTARQTRRTWRTRPPWRVRARLAWAAAACVILLLGAVAAGWPMLRAGRLGLSGERRLETAVSETRSVRLADGSQVVLDTDTLIVDHFGPHDRRLELMRGRARFDVNDDRHTPFIVAVGDRRVIARSGEFDIALSPEHAIAVIPIHGVVQVESRSLSPRPAMSLQPGQRLALDASGDQARIDAAPAAGGLWPSGLLSFQSTPLSRAIAEANRYSQRKVRLADPGLGALAVSGVFRATATADFAASIASMFGLTLTVAPNGDYILSRGQAV